MKSAKKLVCELAALGPAPVRKQNLQVRRQAGGGPPPDDIFPKGGDGGDGKKYAPYGWIVSKEFIDAVTTEEYNSIILKSREQAQGSEQRLSKRLLPIPKEFTPKRIAGPMDIHPEVFVALKSGEGLLFRMWDDDGIPMCEGRWIPDATKVYGVSPTSLTDEDGDPLGDFGEGSYGCTLLTTGEENEPAIG